MKKLLSPFAVLVVLLLNITTYSQLPPPPIYLGLSDSNSATPKLLWSRVPSATSYGLQIATEYFNIIYDSSGIVDTFFQLPQGLPLYTYLFLHLRSINSNGNGPWAIWYPLFLHLQGGIIKLSNTIPDKFSLAQNYPNPFNPSTKIKFSLPFPSKGEVKLVVYDMLGRLVASLIHPLWSTTRLVEGGQEGLKPGTYEVEFSANGGGSALTSGVYFYRLQAGDFTSTQKMVLLK